jgi:uncharacterized protein (TIGR03437 family)
MRMSTVLAFLVTIFICEPALAQAQRRQITSFSVGPDQTLIYPNNPSDPNYLIGLNDEHTSFLPPAASGAPYLLFGGSAVSATGIWGAEVLQTTDLKTFDFASALGYTRQVMAGPLPIGKCNPALDTEFDENYAAPGSVVQDPTLPAGNLMMIYEAENHCPGGGPDGPFYATAGFARSSDNGKTWPAPQPGALGGPARYPVLQSPDPEPTGIHGYLGDAIPAAFVDKTTSGDYYLYVPYSSYSSAGIGLRIARAKLGSDPLTFLKWYNGSFSQPGIGGLDSGILPSSGCAGGYDSHSEISYNDDLGTYLLVFVCFNGPTGARMGGWYYSTATSLDLEDWSAPQLIQNSQYPEAAPCPGRTDGQDFDGFYPSSISPGASAGHTKLTGYFFFMHVACDLGSRQFLSRTFTITATAAPNVPTVPLGSVVNNASFAPGTTVLAPGSIAAVFGTFLTDGTSCLPPSCNPSFDKTSGKLGTTMSGAQVSVNGAPAPIFYASPGQLGIQIPYEASGSSANLSVSVGGQASTPISVPLAPVSPGIFTLTADGKGAGAITHANGSAVTSQSPSQRGEVVIIYATGLGQVAPPVGTGSLPSGASNTVSPVTLTIGGINVIPEFAGLAGCCVGLNQINGKIPAGVASGAAVPVVLTIGGKPSNTATIAVQ